MGKTERFKYFDHTADIKFQAYGTTLLEAFENAALATSNVITDVTKVKNLVEKEISITSKNKESLLYDFLQEIIYLLDTEAFIVSGVKHITISEDKGFTLKAKFTGDYCKNYKTKGDIKSATYNSMFIKEEDDNVTLQVVLDI